MHSVNDFGRKFSWILVGILLLAGPIACGDGGGGSSAPQGSGIFLDAEVEGLSFESSDGDGKTDENGTFTFAVGEPITFSVGGVEIGTVTGATVCTPRDFAEAQINIARFLQSLDADGDPSNGIDLSDADENLSGVEIDASAFAVDSETFGNNAAINNAIDVGKPGAELIDAETAINNLDEGTDTTFDKTELAGKGFVVLLPQENDIGYLGFDPLASSTDTGSVASSLFFTDTLVGGGDGEGEDLEWSVNPETGVLTLYPEGDANDLTTVNRQGGSSRSIGFTFTDTETTDPEAGTLLVPVTITTGSLTGTGTKSYDVEAPAGISRVTFNSNGTFSISDDDGGQDTGTWSIDQNGVLITMLVDDSNDVIMFVLISGDLTTSGELLVADGSDLGGSGEFEDLFVAPITTVN